MIGGRQWCALPARGHIIGPEIIGERHPQRRLQGGTVNQLQRCAELVAFWRAMQHGLPMHPGKARHRPSPAFQQSLPCRQMRVGDHLACLGEDRARLRPGPVPGPRGVGRTLEHSALFRQIFTLRRGSELQHLLAIGQDQRCVDGVQRRARHEARHPIRFRFFTHRVQDISFPCYARQLHGDTRR